MKLAIAQKDALSIKLQGYREIADTAGQNTYRARNTEIRILTAASEGVVWGQSVYIKIYSRSGGLQWSFRR
jgi:hypothetical protein